MFIRLDEFLRDWAQNRKPKNIEFSYYTERAVQDELEKLKHADLWTVSISYMLMFVYITIGLGRFRSWRTILVRMSSFKQFV